MDTFQLQFYKPYFLNGHFHTRPHIIIVFKIYWRKYMKSINFYFSLAKRTIFRITHIKFSPFKEEEDYELYDFSALYMLLKSLYLHMYRAYRGEKGGTEIGYKRTWNSTTTTLVLVRARSKAPIHGTDNLRPHPTNQARKPA